MKFNTKLNLYIVPLIVAPALLISVIFVITTLSRFRGLVDDLLEVHVSNFENQCQSVFNTLKRLGYSEITFYRVRAQDDVIRYAESAVVDDGFLFILDDENRVVRFPGKERDELLTQPDSQEPFGPLVTDGEGILTRSPAELQQFRVIARNFAPWDWTIGVAISERVLYGPLRQALEASFATLALTLGLTMGILVLIARGISQPIEDLKTVSLAMGNGNLGIRSSVDTDDEVGVLATNFNSMADRIQSLTNRLEEKVRERTQLLEDSLETLRNTQDQLVQSEKLSGLAVLVAGISHEVNTPIGVGVTGISYLSTKTEEVTGKFEEGGLQKSELSGFLKTCADTTDLVYRNLSRARELMLGFKQLTGDQVGEAKRLVKIGTYTNEVLMILRPELSKTRLNVEVDVVKDVEISTYPGLLSQVITNLVMNSIAHAFDPGESGTIDIEIDACDGGARLAYRDDGKGMDEDTRRRVFDPFFSTKVGRGGIGLGMHIVYLNVTQKLGGTISLESSPGEGVRFAIQLPLASPG